MKNEHDLVSAILSANLNVMRKEGDSLTMTPVFHWRIHPFGMLRLDVSPDLRLHVWHPELQKPGVSLIHDHAQWDFTSLVLHGAIINTRYTINHKGTAKNALPYMCGVIEAGTLDGGLMNVQEVRLEWEKMERINAGESYRQEAHEIHKTEALPGTITLVRKTHKDTKTARVFWPAGSEWVHALPRKILGREVEFARELLSQAAGALGYGKEEALA